MKYWLLKVLFKDEICEINKLYRDMESKDPDEWQKGFICGMVHALLELSNEPRI